jgi:hypothetical protein
MAGDHARWEAPQIVLNEWEVMRLAFGLAVIAAGESSPSKIGGLVGRPATSLAHRLDMLAAAGFIECRQDLVLPAARTCPVS